MRWFGWLLAIASGWFGMSMLTPLFGDEFVKGLIGVFFIINGAVIVTMLNTPTPDRDN